VKDIRSNQDLLEFLLRLISQLRDAGAAALADRLSFAAHQASGMDMDFPDEARTALQNVLKKEKGVLTPRGRADLLTVIGQLDQVLGQR
jgi:hypothetical protein